ncbi:MAG: TerB family tellurite resistance protein [Myxococcales bacterium]|nr:TerB family tellurite resistance protein [Myxococcales bacterium]
MTFGDGDPLPNLFGSLRPGPVAPFDVQQLAKDFHRTQTDWSVPEAYLAILVAAAMADGKFHEEEQQEIHQIARRSRVLNSLSMNELAAANDTANERLKSRPDALKQACDTLARDMLPSVFAHAVEVVLADGELHKSEAEFLEGLVPMMHLDHDEAKRTVEVLLTKARF